MEFARGKDAVIPISRHRWHTTNRGKVMNETIIAAKVREREIDREAAKLIRQGFAPWPAAIAAARSVDLRRQFEHLHDECDDSQ